MLKPIILQLKAKTLILDCLGLKNLSSITSCYITSNLL